MQQILRTIKTNYQDLITIAKKKNKTKDEKYISQYNSLYVHFA